MAKVVKSVTPAAGVPMVHFIGPMGVPLEGVIVAVKGVCDFLLSRQQVADFRILRLKGELDYLLAQAQTYQTTGLATPGGN